MNFIHAKQKHAKARDSLTKTLKIEENTVKLNSNDVELFSNIKTPILFRPNKKKSKVHLLHIYRTKKKRDTNLIKKAKQVRRLAL